MKKTKKRKANRSVTDYNSTPLTWLHDGSRKICLLLSAFAKLRKAALNFVMSVRLSVRMEQLGSHWTDFHEI